MGGGFGNLIEIVCQLCVVPHARMRVAFSGAGGLEHSRCSREVKMLMEVNLWKRQSKFYGLPVARRSYKAVFTTCRRRNGIMY